MTANDPRVASIVRELRRLDREALSQVAEELARLVPPCAECGGGGILPGVFIERCQVCSAIDTLSRESGVRFEATAEARRDQSDLLLFQRLLPEVLSQLAKVPTTHDVRVEVRIRARESKADA